MDYCYEKQGFILIFKNTVPRSVTTSSLNATYEAMSKEQNILIIRTYDKLLIQIFEENERTIRVTTGVTGTFLLSLLLLAKKSNSCLSFLKFSVIFIEFI